MVKQSEYRVDITLRRLGMPSVVLSQIRFTALRSLKKARDEYDAAKGAVEDLHYHIIEQEAQDEDRSQDEERGSVEL